MLKKTVLHFAVPIVQAREVPMRITTECSDGFILKALIFSKLPSALFTEVQVWMNNYPRKILNGFTPELEFQNI